MRLLQERYESPRQAANVGMMAALEGLSRVFGVQAGPLAAVRSLGLGMLHSVPSVKNQFMRYAMGLPLTSSS